MDDLLIGLILTIFRWAWQNTHLTRHIPPDERITQAITKTKAGRTRKRVGRPRMTMHDKLANLHILLRAKSFERWPLKVVFFAEDVYKMWHRWTANMSEKLRDGLEVEMDQSVLQSKEIVQESALQLVGIYAIDPTYQHLKSNLEKSRKILAEPDKDCTVCQSAVNSEQGMLLVCPTEDCDAIFHMTCLSNHFLTTEKAEDTIVPTQGHCPSCKSRLHWTDLIKDLSLRIRGEKEVTALFKERKRRKKDPTETNDLTAVQDEEQEEVDEDDVLVGELDADMDYDDVLLQSDFEDIDELQTQSVDDDWKIVDDLEEQKSSKQITPASFGSKKVRKEVIEDSDWDEAEVVD